MNNFSTALTSMQQQAKPSANNFAHTSSLRAFESEVKCKFAKQGVQMSTKVDEQTGEITKKYYIPYIMEGGDPKKPMFLPASAKAFGQSLDELQISVSNEGTLVVHSGLAQYDF